MPFRKSFLVALYFCLLMISSLQAEQSFEFGFAKVDVTPTEPLRLSGYGSRRAVFEGVDERLFVRAMALRAGESQVCLLIAVDTIGFPGVFTQSIVGRVEEQHHISRDRIVICGTHSHTAPHISGGLTNIFEVPLSGEQLRQSQEYTDQVADSILLAVGESIADLQPGKLFVGQGRAGFAQNRRVLEGGRWTGFGVQRDGPSDHRLPILKITDLAGKPRGVVFNYACHCTTFGPSYNRVSGDWAGHAARLLEEQYPSMTALCTIGCGADQNPARDNDPAKAKELAQAQGQEIAREVTRLLADNLPAIDSGLSTAFGYAGLPVDRPSVADLKAKLNDRRAQVRRHAQEMLDLRERMGRLPETYPAPVQVWRFGKQLCMVFLGGEVVVDYALRMQKEIDSEVVWMSAYANDVFGYVASERVRREGGYEVDGSMVYYSQPGPWSEGTEEVLVRRIHELVDQGSFASPFTPEEALPRFHLSPGFEIGIVAAEPLISDPVSFAVGADGRLWVVEMSDYPRGENDTGKPGGRVKVLDDVDNDGRYDRATLFLDGLSYPNGVFPWRDGVLISGAPAILFAKDTTGDGRADVRQPLYQGFEEDNPQHRVAGFAYGLDNWLYLASGTNNHEIESVVSKSTVDMSGRDLRIKPEDGLVETTSGRTQFGRNRDDWGNWFGGSNSLPIWHFVLPDRYLRRNPYFSAPEPIVHLITPSLAPPVFPTSRTLDRFNDLFALNRFTSACSPMIFRDVTLGADVEGAAFISEPVHNLVHRAMLSAEGVTFSAHRHPDEQDSEFLSSTDHWFRPTTLSTGPDGALWVADMYRQVIEHPEWIPEAWQAKLDLRAGHDRGRIYRVYRTAMPPTSIPVLADKSSLQLVAELENSNGWRRDTAQRLIVERGDRTVATALADLVSSSKSPLAKVHALGALSGLNLLTAEVVSVALNDKDPRVQRRAIVHAEPLLKVADLAKRVADLGAHPDNSVRLQAAFSLGEWESPSAGPALAKLAVENADDIWIRTAVLSSAARSADQMLSHILGTVGGSRDHSLLLQHLISTAIRTGGVSGLERVLDSITKSADGTPELWEIEALASFDRAIRRQDTNLSKLREGAGGRLTASLDRAAGVVAAARELAGDANAPLEARLVAMPLLATGLGDVDQDQETLAGFLSPAHAAELQIAAIRTLSETDAKNVPKHLLANWRQLSPQVRSEVLNVLLSRRDWHQQLVESIESGQVLASDLDATTRNRLVSTGNREMRDRARKQLGVSTNRDRQIVIDQYQETLRLTGDPVEGAAAFKKTCAACHRHNEVGNEIGASLSALQDKSSESLLIAVLDPNRAVEGKYKAYNCVTVDGRVISGMIGAETTSSITMVLANGTKSTLLRVDIDELVSSGVSFMPEGLEKDFSPQDLADIFAFIRSESSTVR